MNMKKLMKYMQVDAKSKDFSEGISGYTFSFIFFIFDFSPNFSKIKNSKISERQKELKNKKELASRSKTQVKK